jgi:transcriptional regulator GlxA family with amidase domain
MSRAILVVVPAAGLLDVAGPAHILASANEGGKPLLQVMLVGPSGPREHREADTGLPLQTGPLPERVHSDDLIVVCGSVCAAQEAVDGDVARLVDWLRTHALPQRPWIASVSTGAFVLGRAGLLDHRYCTTHHAYVETLRATFPNAKVQGSRMVVRDDKLLTSAGSGAGIDLALQFLALRFGDRAALQVAHDNVVSFRRLSTDPPVSGRLQYRLHVNPLVHAVQDGICDAYAASVPVTSLADAFGISYRQLTRVFQRETGVTLKQYERAVKLSHARELISEGRFPLQAVAERSGFHSVQALRIAWKRQEGSTLADFRQRAVAQAFR